MLLNRGKCHVNSKSTGIEEKNTKKRKKIGKRTCRFHKCFRIKEKKYIREKKKLHRGTTWRGMGR